LGWKKMSDTETFEIESDTAGCDGGGGPLGHPMVYLKIEAQKGTAGGSVVCPYCSRRFVLKPGASTQTSH